MRIACLLLVATGCQTTATDGPDVDYPTSKEDAARAVGEGKSDGWSFDVCDVNGWYGDGKCEWFCPKRDSDCDLAPLGPEPAGSATRYPIIFQQGVGTGQNLWFFRGVAERLRQDGHMTYQAAFEVDMPAFQSPEVRAGFLAQVVDRALADTGAAKVNIVAHSMGGLDARVLANRPDMAGKIASITSISTPHRGSLIADIILGVVDNDRTGAISALGAMYGEFVSGHVSDDENIRAGLNACSEQRAPSFNNENPDVAGIFYQSWAGLSNVFGIVNPRDVGACEGKMLFHGDTRHKMSGLLVKAAAFVAHGVEARPNDGFTARSGASSTAASRPITSTSSA